MNIQPYHIQNTCLFRTRGIFKSLSNKYSDHTYSEPLHSQDSLFKHFQKYLGIFRDIDVYSATLTGTQLVRRRRETNPALFENLKKCPDFGKKGLDCIHLLVELSIQKAEIQNFSRRNIPKMFSVEPLFLVVFPKCLSKPPSSTNPPPFCPETFLVVHLHFGIILSAKCSILNVWQCSENVTSL